MKSKLITFFACVGIFAGGWEARRNREPAKHSDDALIQYWYQQYSWNYDTFLEYTADNKCEKCGKMYCCECDMCKGGMLHHPKLSIDGYRNYSGTKSLDRLYPKQTP